MDNSSLVDECSKPLTGHIDADPDIAGIAVKVDVVRK